MTINKCKCKCKKEAIEDVKKEIDEEIMSMYCMRIE